MRHRALIQPNLRRVLFAPGAKSGLELPLAEGKELLVWLLRDVTLKSPTAAAGPV